MKSNRPSFNGFLRYVFSQHNTRGIDHRSWNSCAVGDYFRYLGKDLNNDEAMDLSEKLFGVKQADFRSDLNEAASYVHMGHTYGGLKDYCRKANLMPKPIRKK